MNEFIEQFLIECNELVAQATDDLLALEEKPQARERLDSAFRAFHTLKGAAGIVDFAAMEVALHAAEDVLGAVRGGVQPITPVLIGDCLTCLDQVVQWLGAMQETGEPPVGADLAAKALVAQFKRALDVEPVELQAEPAAATPAPAGFSEAAHALLLAQQALLDDTASESGMGRAASAARVVINLLRALGRNEDASILERDLIGPDGASDPGQVRAAILNILNGAPLAPAEMAAVREVADPVSRGLRVDVERIDALVNLTGELTVAKNALAHAAALARDGASADVLAAMLKDQYSVLDRLVGDLQRSVLNTRMVPLRQVFQRFPRLVREVVVSLGKPVRFVTEGDATEADRAVVEPLFEPLLHVIRNAVDHGVEPVDVRTAAGKPASATITLRGARDGDRVLVEVEDDGGGIDLSRVRAVAAKRGVVRPDVLAAMTDEAVADLIFAPGFSTVEAVTNLSGRGVGMDAVRGAVERLGGRVSIRSRPGQGTTVSFALPLTVMMTRVMTVESGGQVFGIPIDAVLETVQAARADIVPVGAARALLARGRTIPLIDLGKALGEQGGDIAAPTADVVIVAAGEHRGGLEVDRLGEAMTVMLRPMEGLLASTPGIAGTTLLGDGRVLIVLDIQQLL